MTLCVCVPLGAGAPLRAQADTRDPAIQNLPRPGFEPRSIRTGGFVISPSIDADATYDGNIFATPRQQRADAIFHLKPQVTVERNDARLSTAATVRGDFLRYASTPRENVNTFGASLEAQRQLGGGQDLSGSVSFDRTYQRRSDPEADVDAQRPPALINMVTGDLRYRIQGARFGLIASATATRLDYLPVEDADRDLLTYRASVRGLVSVGPRISIYIEPFYERRDARLAVDRSGVNRDNRTTGGLAGVSVDLADKLQGSVGIGAFRSNPAGAGLRSFTGIAASGRLSWRPRTRTLIGLDLFRGDVATIRTGAIGRIDTRVGVSVDQEVRHNLLLSASAGLRDVHYRGTIGRDQRYRTVAADLRYLMNRHWSLRVGTDYTHRGADDPPDRFNRVRATVGLRFIY